GVTATVRLFSGASGELVEGPSAEFQPFGEDALGGVNLAASNDPPNDDSYSVVHDRTLTVDATEGVLSNDGDPSTLTAALASDVSHGSLDLAPDGGFTYVPSAGYTGTDSFTYDVSD